MAQNDHPEHADDELLQHQDKFYILATSSRTDDRTRVLKHGRDVRGLRLLRRRAARRSRRAGDLPRRHALPLAARAAPRRPAPAAAELDGEEGERPARRRSVEPGPQGRGRLIYAARGELHLFRGTFLCNGVCYERLRVSSFSREKLSVDLRLDFDADFADIFEVRGAKRERRGRRFDAASTAAPWCSLTRGSTR